MTSKNIDTNRITGSEGTNYNDDLDFSIVDKQFIDDNIISSSGSGNLHILQMSKKNCFDELENQQFSLKDMDSGTQALVDIQTLISTVQ